MTDDLTEWDAEVDLQMRLAETAEAAVSAVREGYGTEFNDEDFDAFLALVREGLG